MATSADLRGHGALHVELLIGPDIVGGVSDAELAAVFAVRDRSHTGR
jgi:hypothetical protein